MATLEELLGAHRAIGQVVTAKQEALKVERAMELQTLAQRYGLKVRISSPHALGGKRPPKYRHPENPDLTWCGRGMRPHWVRSLEEQGMNREEWIIHPDAEALTGQE